VRLETGRIVGWERQWALLAPFRASKGKRVRTCSFKAKGKMGEKKRRFMQKRTFSTNKRETSQGGSSVPRGEAIPFFHKRAEKFGDAVRREGEEKGRLLWGKVILYGGKTVGPRGGRDQHTKLGGKVERYARASVHQTRWKRETVCGEKGQKKKGRRLPSGEGLRTAFTTKKNVHPV